jgi:topoisomerase IA-like protein
MAGENFEIKEEFTALNELIPQPAAPEEGFLTARDLLNRTVIIQSIEFYQGQFGEYAVVKTDQGYLRTGGRVLMKQLKEISRIMQERKLKGVRATLKKRKSASGRDYYLFE